MRLRELASVEPSTQCSIKQSKTVSQVVPAYFDQSWKVQKPLRCYYVPGCTNGCSEDGQHWQKLVGANFNSVLLCFIPCRARR